MASAVVHSEVGERWGRCADGRCRVVANQCIVIWTGMGVGYTGWAGGIQPCQLVDAIQGDYFTRLPEALFFVIFGFIYVLSYWSQQPGLSVVGWMTGVAPE